MRVAKLMAVVLNAIERKLASRIAPRHAPFNTQKLTPLAISFSLKAPFYGGSNKFLPILDFSRIAHLAPMQKGFQRKAGCDTYIAQRPSPIIADVGPPLRFQRINHQHHIRVAAV